MSKQARDPRIPDEGRIYVHRASGVRVEVLKVREPRYWLASVLYRRVDGGRRTQLNVSRFSSIYRVAP